MRSSLICLAALMLGSLAGAAAADRPYLDITGADFQPLPIAVDQFVALDGDSELAREIRDTLVADLAGSGLFNSLDPRSFLKNPARDGFSATTIDFAPWSNVGADALVKAQVGKGKGAPLKAEFKLFAVTQAREELRKVYEVPREAARAVAHAFADALVRYYTGERSTFQTSIAFVRKTATGKEIVVADFDGARPRVVVPGDVVNLLPSWSPDGSWLAVTSYREGAPLLYRVPAAGGTLQLIARKGALTTGAAWSPDGQFIAFTADVEGNADIYRMRADGSDLRKLTDFWGIDTSPCWSPDGKRIAFVSTRSGNPQIYVMNADGSNPERLTYQGNYNQTPDWSPRGDLIAFTGRDERNVFDLFTVDVATKRIARLTQDQGNNEEPSWSPNGRQLAFSSTRGGRSEIWVMLADGSGQRRIVACATGCFTPAWGPWTQGSGPVVEITR